ncbi:MAG: pilin [Elusimicrobiaceae bacterium]|nr:pilin [Elusimicrobiaceae bacterium]
MKNQAFTLIELLVVVLIIGILAAIAVPKYQKVVLKSRLTTGLPLTKAIYDAQQVYKLSTGSFATDIDDLDISVPKGADCQKINTDKHSYYECDNFRFGLYDNRKNVQYMVRANISDFYPIAYLKFLENYNQSGVNARVGEEWCFADKNTKVAKDVCKELGGQEYSTSGWAVKYRIVK